MHRWIHFKFDAALTEKIIITGRGNCMSLHPLSLFCKTVSIDLFTVPFFQSTYRKCQSAFGIVELFSYASQYALCMLETFPSGFCCSQKDASSLCNPSVIPACTYVPSVRTQSVIPCVLCRSCSRLVR